MKLFFKSIIIGICAILPGVSGSVIAVSFGIYDELIRIVTNYKEVLKHKKYLFIVIIGTLIGIYFCSYFLLYIYKYKTIIYYSLSGIILSEIPFLVKKIHIKSKICICPMIISFLLSLLLDLINSNNSVKSFSFFKYLLGGILFSFGKVFPGVSSSFFLVSLGIFENIIVIITNPFLIIKNFNLYLPFIIGSIVGFIIFLKLLSFLLNKKTSFMYSIILGFMISSVFVIIPSFKLSFENIVGIILMISFFVLFIYIKAKND